MILFQKGQSIDNRYTVVFPHKEGTYAETYRGRFPPQWFVLPISLEPHCHGVNDWIFRKQRLDVVSERTGGIERTKPVGDVAKLDVKLLCEGEKWLGIKHIEKAKSRPVALPKRGRVPGSVGCKGTTFIPIRKIFLGKSA